MAKGERVSVIVSESCAFGMWNFTFIQLIFVIGGFAYVLLLKCPLWLYGGQSTRDNPSEIHHLIAMTK